ncbi:DUF1189 domain-containing protein [Bacillus sp. NSP9.1]|uniref:DUF1189 domain-containing protein n=1 Tax=Bacillus sp. NSP9.1 TaxID=1071078 RepID=UPI0004109A37|nr:DUF1189 family protein [Bacillus sp. NSP9.1]QHZ48420.1 DUF1189 domain-containing protein [Bacillus sp. NSP9.1]
MGNLQHDRLIIRFLKAAASPTGVCRYRNTFSWLHITFLFLFLSGCLMVPFAVSFMKMERFNVGLFMPSVVQKSDQAFAEQLKGYQFRNGKLTGGADLYRIEKGGALLAVDLKHEVKTSGENGRLKVEGYQNAIVFQADHLIISDQNGTGFSIRYVKEDVRLSDLNVFDLKTLLGTLWFAQYKPMIMMLAYSVIFIVALFLTGVLAGGIWITKKSKMTGIASFKEAAAAAVCGSAFPAFAAAVFGMIHFDFIAVLLIYSCSTALMISFIFRHLSKTRHQNENLQSGGNHGKSAAI